MQMSFQTTANAWTVGRFWTYIEAKHAQGPNIANLYLANIGSSGSWVRGRDDMVWRWREGKTYFGVPAQALLGFLLRLFWGKCPAEMT